MKSIISIVAISFLLSLYTVEVTAKTDPFVERLCFETQYPSECVRSVSPNLPDANIDAVVVLQAGLKALINRADKALTETEKLKKEAGADQANVKDLDVCLKHYQKVKDSGNKAMEAIPTKNYAMLESELDCQVTAVKDCQNQFESAGKSSPVGNINAQLIMLIKNNLSIGNHLIKPTLPHY